MRLSVASILTTFLWDKWKSPTGEVVNYCNIRTATANEFIVPQANINVQVKQTVTQQDYDLPMKLCHGSGSLFFA